MSAIPAEDATRRVIGLLEREGKQPDADAVEAVESMLIAPAGSQRYVVTSVVGNFLIARRGSRWLVGSLPGD